MTGRSLTPDLDGTHCAVTDCLDVADILASTAVTVHPDTGVPDDQADLVLDVPLCAEHAHLLRMGVTRCQVTT